MASRRVIPGVRGGGTWCSTFWGDARSYPLTHAKELCMYDDTLKTLERFTISEHTSSVDGLHDVRNGHDGVAVSIFNGDGVDGLGALVAVGINQRGDVDDLQAVAAERIVHVLDLGDWEF